LNRQPVTAVNAIAYYSAAPLPAWPDQRPSVRPYDPGPRSGRGNCLASLSGRNQRAALSVGFPCGVLAARPNGAPRFRNFRVD
jgi:hypothetical protein